MYPSGTTSGSAQDVLHTGVVVPVTVVNVNVVATVTVCVD